MAEPANARVQQILRLFEPLGAGARLALGVTRTCPSDLVRLALDRLKFFLVQTSQ
jgi:hypothetical protein